MNIVKKTVSYWIIICVLLSSLNISTVSASTLGSGKLNKAGSINWSLSSEGILTISGSGIPDNYTSAKEVPWDTLRECIRKVQIDTDTDGITNMSYWFQDCTNLSYVNRLPSNVNNLCAAFSGCVSLKESPSIPMSVDKMNSTYRGCTSLKKIPEFELLSVSDFSYAFMDCKSLEYAYMLISYPVTSVKSILRGCTNLNATVMFNGCTQLTSDKCSNMFTDTAEKDGTSINIFSSNMSLDSVKKLISTDYSKLNYCGEIGTDKLSDYNFDYGTQCSYAYIEDKNTLYIDGSGEIDTDVLLERFKNSSKVKVLKIGYGINKIGISSFENYYSLETVFMPDTVNNIGKSVFKGCSALENISLPVNLSVIGESAFSGCSGLDSLYIPDSVKSIGNGAFSGMDRDFFLECSSDNAIAQGFASENGIKCRYPEVLSVTYKGNVVEGCRLNTEYFEPVMLLYSDGTKEEIPFEEILIDDYEIKAGENTLTAHYGDFACQFQVTGTERSIINLEAVYDTEYDSVAVEGGTIDTKAISVLAEYDNGTGQYLEFGGITDADESVSSQGYYTIDKYNLVVSTDGSLNSITIRARVTGSSPISKICVINVPAQKKSITGISAIYKGGDIVEGTGVNTENIYAYANFNNGTKERILFSGDYNKYGISINTDYIVLDNTVDYNDEFNVSDEYMYSIDAYGIKNGENIITLWCDNKQAVFKVKGISKSQTGISAVYNGTAIEDGKLDMDKLDVSVTYNNGDKEILTAADSIMFQDNYSISKGDNYIDVIYVDYLTGKKYKCSVYVYGVEKKPVEITGIVPVRTDIVSGEPLKDIAFNVSVLYDNGKTYDSIEKWDLKGCAIEGENRIHVSYKGLEGEAVFQAGEFIPRIVTSVGTEPPDMLEKNSSVMLMIESNSQSATEGKDVGWSSSDNGVVRVSETGMATAVNYGTARITAIINGKKAIYDVEVPMPDIKGIRAEYDGMVLEDTEVDKDKIRVYFILENEDSIELTDISGITLQKDYCIKEGTNHIELYYIDKDTAQKYACTLEINGIGKTPVEIISAEAVRDDIIAGEALRTLEFSAEILYDNEKIYKENIKYEGKGFAQEGINSIIIYYKGVRGEAQFNAGKFIPQIVQKSGGKVPEEIILGGTVKLKVISNCDAAMENKTILWRSSDENVMTVNEDGDVRIIKEGTSDITATVNDESVKCTIKVIIPSEDLSITSKSITMSKGTSKKVTYKMVPENSTDKITWISSNTDVAVVSAEGKISAKGTGTCIITAKTDSKIQKTVKVTVKKEASGIKIDYKKAYLIKGRTLKLKYSIPAGTYTDRVSWYSSNKKVASVSQAGIVTARQTGTAVISVKTSAGKKAACTIYVRTNPGKVVLNKSSVELKKGKTLKLKYTIPAKSYVSAVTWSSSNKKIASVSSAGKVKALSKGTAYIKIRTNNNKTAKCRIKVV